VKFQAIAEKTAKKILGEIFRNTLYMSRASHL